MTFKQDIVTLPELEQINTDNGRFYRLKGSEEDSVKYPSVTTILGSDPAKKEILAKWRARVGEEEADKISHMAITKGNAVHELIENYIQNKPLPESMPAHYESFLLLKSKVDPYIDNIRCIETRMISKHLRVAGTVDCIAEYRGTLSIIDWKTSARLKKKDWISNYFMQSAAYSVMFEENTGIPVPQIVIVMACGTGQCQLFIEKRDTWIDEFKTLRDNYEKENQ
jgi:ATP-dependent exoDNAse (exonuclease V) beta subunit|tara:strand:- start:1829 stop:2503 length:675 start_codon:yes stop_codon:yes gene_type:complete